MFSIIRSRQIDKTATLRLQALGHSETEARHLISVLRDGWKHSPRWRRDELVQLAPDAHAAGLEGRDMYRFYRAVATLAFTTGAPITSIATPLLRAAASGRLLGADLRELEALGAGTWMLGRKGPHIEFRELVESGHVTYEYVITSILDARGPRP